MGVIVKWKISRLRSLTNQSLDVQETLKFSKEMFDNVSNIIGVSDVKVNGRIYLLNNEVYADLNIKGIYQLPCIYTSQIGDQPFEFKIEGNLKDEYPQTINYEADFIDLLEVVWQKLIVEAPLRFVKSKVNKKEGESWKYMSEDDYIEMKSSQIDPRFEKLKDLFKDDKEDK